MESISVIEAVRRATDPFGMSGTRTAAMRPSAAEVIDRLAELGFVVVPARGLDVFGLNEGSLLDAIRERDPDYLISESEMRVNR